MRDAGFAYDRASNDLCRVKFDLRKDDTGSNFPGRSRRHLTNR